MPSLDKLVSVRRRYAAHSSHLEFGMCLGQEPTHCHTWHVHFHLSRWRCGQGESNICINQAGNWYSDARARAVRARRKFWRFSSKVSKRSKAAKILAIFVKSVKSVKSHATAKILKMVKSTGLLAEAKISQKWSKFSRLQNPTLRLCRPSEYTQHCVRPLRVNESSWKWAH